MGSSRSWWVEPMGKKCEERARAPGAAATAAQAVRGAGPGEVDGLSTAEVGEALGMSMDYEIFLVSRMREEWQSSGDNVTAVAHGLERAGGVVTNAALLFIIVAGSFIFTHISEIQEVGLGLAVAVFVDAFLVRSLLVPSVMRLLGRANWWFPFVRLPVKGHTQE